jgi:hypothetical protein
VSYRAVQASLGHTPLQDPRGQAWLRAFGIVKDFLAQRARASVLQRMPLSAAEDALGVLGTERGVDLGSSLQRSPAEALSAYRERVRRAWETWGLGGTAWGMLKAFAAQGYYPEIVCANGLVYSVDVGLNLTIVQGPPLASLLRLWSHFFVWFRAPPSSWTDIVSPPTPSSTPSIYELRRLRHIVIDRWRPAWTRCIGIGVLVSGGPGIWGAPGSTWGTGTWGSSVVKWFSATDRLTWGFPPSYRWGTAGLKWGGQV